MVSDEKFEKTGEIALSEKGKKVSKSKCCFQSRLVRLDRFPFQALSSLDAKAS